MHSDPLPCESSPEGGVHGSVACGILESGEGCGHQTCRCRECVPAGLWQLLHFCGMRWKFETLNKGEKETETKKKEKARKQ